jgi:uncharacterized protein with PIN domain
MDPPRLAADETLGRLALWLRAVGLDVLYLPPRTPLARKKILVRGRLFLTRTRGLILGPTLVVESDRAWEQVTQVLDWLNLAPTALRPFSRCLRCNVPLVPAGREEVEGLIPDHVALVQAEFHLCPACGRVYWPGSHVEKMSARIGSFLAKMT